MPYSYGQHQDLNEVLTSSEAKLAGCKHPQCDYETLFENLYHTIPDSIHSSYVENIEMHLLEKKHRVVKPNQFGPPFGELIAYPQKQEFAQESEIYDISTDPSSSNLHHKISIFPSVLDFGPR